jgi:hypothetical protein
LHLNIYRDFSDSFLFIFLSQDKINKQITKLGIFSFF